LTPRALATAASNSASICFRRRRVISYTLRRTSRQDRPCALARALHRCGFWCWDCWRRLRSSREVFHANFSTKFSVWDYLFGTVYDPGRKPGDQPENWGLYYDFPKDYFLQHAFSVKRFDEQKLLRYPWFNWYYNLRPRIVNWLSSKWKIFRKFNPVAEQAEYQPSNNLPSESLELSPVQENYISYDK